MPHFASGNKALFLGLLTSLNEDFLQKRGIGGGVGVPLDSRVEGWNGGGGLVIHQIRKIDVMGNLACLGYIGDEQLPGCEGFIVNHFKNPYIKQPGFNGK